MSNNLQSLSFDSIASLTAVIGAPGLGVTVKGFYVPGDGGGGDFYWDETSTATAVSGMILKNASVATGRWIRRYDPNFIAVNLFGILPDGVTDYAVLWQAAINFANGRVLYVPSGTYIINSTLTNATGSYLRIYGTSTSRTTILKTNSAALMGYLLKPVAGYDLKHIYLQGDSRRDGLTLLGSSTGNGGNSLLQDVDFGGCEFGVRFDVDFQHPLSLNYTNVVCTSFKRAGIVIGFGGTSAGESSWVFDNVITTNQNVLGDPAGSIVVTPGTNSDVITWDNTATPYFGWLIMRRPTGSTDGNAWTVPTNWTSGGLNAGTFTASKPVGTTWDYKVYKQTVGCYIARGKAITYSGQSEYTGIGLFLNGVFGATVTSCYYEWRGGTAAETIPQFAGVYVAGSNAVIESGWAELASYGVFSFNSNLKVGPMRFNSCILSAVGINNNSADALLQLNGPVLSGTPATVLNPGGGIEGNTQAILTAGLNDTTQSYNHETESDVIVMRRGANQGILRSDSVGSRLIVNQVQVALNSKVLIPQFSNNSGVFTILANGGTTNVITATFPVNGGGSILMHYTIGVTDVSSVARITAGGQLIWTWTNASGTLVHNIVDTHGAAIQNGTLTTLTFAAATTAANVGTLSVTVSASSFPPDSVRFTPIIISQAGGTPLNFQLL